MTAPQISSLSPTSLYAEMTNPLNMNCRRKGKSEQVALEQPQLPPSNWAASSQQQPAAAIYTGKRSGLYSAMNPMNSATLCWKLPCILTREPYCAPCWTAALMSRRSRYHWRQKLASHKLPGICLAKVWNIHICDAHLRYILNMCSWSACLTYTFWHWKQTYTWHVSKKIRKARSP